MPLYYYETSPFDLVLPHQPKCKMARKEEKQWSAEFDVTGYGPEELKLRLEGQDLILSGEQEQKTETSSFNRSFSRKWHLPKNLDLTAMETKLEDGKLKVTAPRKPNSVEFPINVVQKKTEKVIEEKMDDLD